uniref:NADH-ubiquinone oxidoreductase chain 4L n=1 Tax=Opistoplatys sp. HL-2013 TaxID=1347747 RepID=A0A7I6HJL4_9HEMI|nr:NADH dehydrogenase subunit 4L [Opistoplatys sp. HL-2013]
MVYLSMLIIFSGALVFCSMRKHLLLTLLSIEFMSLGLYLIFYTFLMYYEFSIYYVLIFLTFIVCEGVAGLSILVTLIRVHGNDMINSLSLLSW